MTHSRQDVCKTHRPRAHVLGRLLLMASLSVLGLASARAEDVERGSKVVAKANASDTRVRGRLTTSLGYLGEQASGGTGAEASPFALVWSDLRARIEATRTQGTGLGGLGDFRLRLTPDTDSARGYKGGREVDLRELYLSYIGESVTLSAGRLILRDLDALTIDGLSLSAKRSSEFEYGVAGGFFPNPYSRTLGSDYRIAPEDARSIVGYPVATGAWAGYRNQERYGALGIGAIFPRSTPAVKAEPVRSFIAARGYARVTEGLNVFHYGVLDLSGAAGTQLTNLQVGLTYKVSRPLTLELAYSHMSTYAIETYLRNYLEDEIAGAPSIVNNLDVARVGADEGRLGADYAFVDSGLDLFGQVRYRRRDALDTSKLAPDIAKLPAETQLDYGVGARKKAAFAGWDLGANANLLKGDRSTSHYVLARMAQSFLDERFDVELDVGYLAYRDNCAKADPTCTGTSSGKTLRTGLGLAFRPNASWLFFGDYHYSRNFGTVGEVSRAVVTGHALLLRGQYVF